MTSQTKDLKDRQLALLIDLDEARDSVDDDGDPMSMFEQIARVMVQHFHAEGCSIILIDQKTSETEAITSIGIPRDMAESLAREAVDFSEPRSLSSSAWSHTLGLRIELDREQTVPGSIVLVRNDAPFPQDDIDLLVLAESQIDSAVIQARTMWRLAERNRELEAIYHIDRLRDDATDEETLYATFTSLIAKQYGAEFCQFILLNPDHDTLETRSLVDNRGLSESAQNAIIENTRDLQAITQLQVPDVVPGCNLLACPLIVAGTRMGAVIVGRAKPFSVNDTRLMVAIASQMDSAIAKSRTNLQLEQRTRELEAIYRIDHIRDRENDFDEMLQQVLVELCHAVSSETGYIMLYNAEKEDALEIRAATRDGVISRPEYLSVIQRISREALQSERVVTYNTPDGSVRSIVATPLILNEQIIGVFGAINSTKPRGFSADDGRILSAITSQVDTAVFERLERRRMRKVLSRSVDPKVLEHLLKRADDSVLGGERVVLTVLFADLRGSTEWAERTNPEELVSILNTFLGMMTDVVFKYEATLDKFVGDEVIALFGSPIPMEDHALRASKAALEMQAVHKVLRSELERKGQELPEMGIGISTGEVIAGEFGPSIRTDFTAMGRVMNLGARLCGAAEGNQTIISENTYNTIKAQAEVNKLGTMQLKGIKRDVATYELIKIVE